MPVQFLQNRSLTSSTVSPIAKQVASVVREISEVSGTESKSLLRTLVSSRTLSLAHPFKLVQTVSPVPAEHLGGALKE